LNKTIFGKIKQIFIKVKTPKILADPDLLNMSQELYEDATYFCSFLGSAGTDRDIRKYKRIIILCYCASTEAWINGQLRSFLTNKNPRGTDEQKLLDFLESPIEGRIPPNYLGIRSRLYKILGKLFTGSEIDFQTQPIVEFENYMNLSNVRNMIMHYVPKNRSNIYDTYFSAITGKSLSSSVTEAPIIISNLYKKINNINNQFEIPFWTIQ
jgi:hypothetical protein